MRDLLGRGRDAPLVHVGEPGAVAALLQVEGSVGPEAGVEGRRRVVREVRLAQVDVGEEAARRLAAQPRGQRCARKAVGPAAQVGGTRNTSWNSEKPRSKPKAVPAITLATKPAVWMPARRAACGQGQPVGGQAVARTRPPRGGGRGTATSTRDDIAPSVYTAGVKARSNTTPSLRDAVDVRAWCARRTRRRRSWSRAPGVEDHAARRSSAAERPRSASAPLLVLDGEGRTPTAGARHRRQRPRTRGARPEPPGEALRPSRPPARRAARGGPRRPPSRAAARRTSWGTDSRPDLPAPHLALAPGPRAPPSRATGRRGRRRRAPGCSSGVKRSSASAGRAQRVAHDAGSDLRPARAALPSHGREGRRRVAPSRSSSPLVRARRRP